MLQESVDTTDVECVELDSSPNLKMDLLVHAGLILIRYSPNRMCAMRARYDHRGTSKM